MKTIHIIKSIISFIVLIAVAMALGSCKGSGADPEPKESDRVTALLVSGQWKLKSLTIDGVAKSSFPNLAITFTSSAYTASNGDPVWPSSGSWTFTDDTAKSIMRSDQTLVTIESIDANNLTLSLTWTKATIGPGRSASVAGTHVFAMGK